MPHKTSRKQQRREKKCPGCMADLPPVLPDVDLANYTVVRCEGPYNIRQVFSAQRLDKYEDFVFARLKPHLQKRASRGYCNEVGKWIANPDFDPRVNELASSAPPTLLLVANPGHPELSSRDNHLLVEFLLHRRDFYQYTARYLDVRSYRDYIRHGQDEWAEMRKCPAFQRWKKAVKPAEEGYESD